MAKEPLPPPPRSRVGLCVVLGSLTLATIGAIWPVPPDFTVVSGAIYGFLLGAFIGVLLD